MSYREATLTVRDRHIHLHLARSRVVKPDDSMNPRTGRHTKSLPLCHTRLPGIGASRTA